MIKPLCKIKPDLDEDEERADDSQEKKNQFVVIREKKTTKLWGVLKDLWFPGHLEWEKGRKNKSTKEQALVIFPGRKRRTTLSQWVAKNVSYVLTWIGE